jgi:hypothetical protein
LLIVLLTGLGLLLFWFSIVASGQENCGSDCSNPATFRAGAAIVLVGAVVFHAVFVRRPQRESLRVHCYGCGATTEVRTSQVAEDLENADWVSVKGKTYCRECAAGRSD